MDKNNLLKFAPSFLVIFGFILQYNLFVTPQELEIKHREIVSEISNNYVTKAEMSNFKDTISDMQKKIDKIYDILTIKKGV